MSRFSILRLLREMYQEFRTFGNPEIRWIRSETEQLQRDLKQLKVLKEEQQRRQEVMTLAALKMGAQRMKGLQQSKDVLNKQSEEGAAAQMEETLDRLEHEGRPIMEDVAYRRVKAKAEAAIRAVGLAGFLSIPDKSIVSGSIVAADADQKHELQPRGHLSAAGGAADGSLESPTQTRQPPAEHREAAQATAAADKSLPPTPRTYQSPPRHRSRGKGS